ncbi:MAG: hypothetical protein V4730_11490 [Pseudomonadota bacterium]
MQFQHSARHSLLAPAQAAIAQVVGTPVVVAPQTNLTQLHFVPSLASARNWPALLVQPAQTPAVAEKAHCQSALRASVPFRHSARSWLAHSVLPAPAPVMVAARQPSLSNLILLSFVPFQALVPHWLKAWALPALLATAAAAHQHHPSSSPSFAPSRQSAQPLSPVLASPAAKAGTQSL